jgi:hypothetical protein
MKSKSQKKIAVYVQGIGGFLFPAITNEGFKVEGSAKGELEKIAEELGGEEKAVRVFNNRIYIAYTKESYEKAELSDLKKALAARGYEIREE